MHIMHCSIAKCFKRALLASVVHKGIVHEHKGRPASLEEELLSRALSSQLMPASVGNPVILQAARPCNVTSEPMVGGQWSAMSTDGCLFGKRTGMNPSTVGFQQLPHFSSSMP